MASLVCLLSIATALAGDPDPQDLRAQAERLQREAQELKAQGKGEAANDTMRQAKELMAQAKKLQDREITDRPERQRARELRAELEKARDELKELQAAGKEDEALRARRHVRELQAELERVGRPEPDRVGPPRERNGGDIPPGPPDMQRLRHLQVAIDNLHAAGMHDLAEHLARQAEALRASQPRPGALGAPGLQPGGEVQRLQAEIQELRQNIRELNRRVEELSRDRRQ